MIQHRNYKDYLDFMLERSRYAGGDNGRGDSVGRTVRAAIIYGGVFIDSIAWAFRGFLNGGPWNPRRHPELGEGFSRDHTVWFVVWIKYFCPESLAMALRIPYRICKGVYQRDVFLWIRAVARGWWIDKFLYWAVAGSYLRFVAWWNDLLRKRATIVSVDYKDFIALPDKNLTKKELFARNASFPSYSFDIQAYMVQCLAPGYFKRRLQKRVIALVEPTNWLIRKLMDDKFSAEELEEIKKYTGMDSWRWGRRLDKTTGNERFALEGPQPDWNMDVDALA